MKFKNLFYVIPLQKIFSCGNLEDSSTSSFASSFFETSTFEPEVNKQMIKYIVLKIQLIIEFMNL